MQPYKRQFGVAIFFLLIFSSTQAGIPALLQPLLDGTFVQRDERYLVWAPIGIIVISTIRAIAGFGSQYLFSWVSTKIVFDIRNQVFNSYVFAPTEFFDSHTTGSLISKITYDATRVSDSGTTVLVSLIRDSFTVIGLVAYITYTNWKLSALVFVLGVVVALLIKLLGRTLRRLHKKLQNDYSHMTHILEESIKGHKIIKIYGGQDKERARFADASNWVRRMQMKTQSASLAGAPIIEIFSAFIMAVIIYISARPGDDALTVGSFMAFFTSLVLLINPVKNLTKINDEIQKAIAAAESLFSMIDVPPEPNAGTVDPGRLSGGIRLVDASFSYPGADKKVFENLSLTIPEGATVAIVGASGSGKSTIASIIARLYQVDSGVISADGVDITDYDIKGYRENISYVSQDVILFNDTVANNIGYGLAASPDESRLVAAARDAYALEFIEQLPNGFDTVVGENGVRLSGGQRQRIAIARALLKDAPILILDEATSALDSASERHIQLALENLRRNRTTIIVAHRLSTIENADNIIVLENGAIIETGTHGDLLGRSGRYASLYKSHLSYSD